MGDCRLNSNVRILCADEITIGDGVSIAWNVQLLHSNRHELWVNGEKRKRSSPIVVGDNVWIGHDTTITKGVEIGDGAIVASNSVVLNDVPENTIVGGCPAEILEGSGIAWSR
ncbi:acyltransferase [Halorientalis persicus]|nr:acyltransferase [Halorientalis persicus]